MGTGMGTGMAIGMHRRQHLKARVYRRLLRRSARHRCIHAVRSVVGDVHTFAFLKKTAMIYVGGRKVEGAEWDVLPCMAGVSRKMGHKLW